jgi:DUF971 family protein
VVFSALTDSVVREISTLKYGGKSAPEVTFSTFKGIEVRSGSEIVAVDPMDLRLKCQCALCVDEYTGEARLKAASIPSSIHPTAISRLGNYAVSMQWSDGHASIFPYDVLTKALPN